MMVVVTRNGKAVDEQCPCREFRNEPAYTER